MTIRVASVPARHPYVEHLAWPDGGDGAPADAQVVRLSDPPVIGEDGQTRWWPPRMLDPTWLRDHADEFDVLHVHFGFESFTPAHLSDVVDTAHALGKGVVVTVHDLRNPHVADERVQLERLDVLVPRADVVLTLTPGAAGAIRERWGRDALVVPHPHIVELDEIRPAQREEGAPAADERRTTATPSRHDSPSGEPPTDRPQLVGLHLKSLRTNTDPLGALTALEQVKNTRGDAVENVVTVHRSVLDPRDGGHRADVAARLDTLVSSGTITLVAHEPMSDESLHAHLRTLDVSVMAYTWGTHSGWIEMCHDLGIRVVAPRIGFYAEQHGPVTYELSEPDGEDATPCIDPARLAVAVEGALDTPAPVAATREERIIERRAVAEAHARAYREAMERASLRSSP